MGLFSFTQEIAMDLGTANTVIISGGMGGGDEPSVVALDRRTDKMIAVGDKAHIKPSRAAADAGELAGQKAAGARFGAGDGAGVL